jgi:glycosyltransferase involved in cell wall biosynthesis
MSASDPAKSRPIRVLLICDSYPPVLGGSEIEAQRVSAGMIRCGHQVHVLCSGGPPMPAVRDWIDPSGIPVTILTRQSRGVWKDRVFALQVARTIWSRRDSYDVVYFLMQGLHLAAGLPVAHLLKKPTVMKVGGSNVIPLMRRSKMGRRELDWMQQWRVPVMVLNQGMTEEARADGFSDDQIVWMPNPIDPDEFRPALPGESASWRESHGIPAGVPVVIYVGRLSREKGLRELIAGFARGAQRYPDALLLLVGDGAMRSELESLARAANLTPEQIRFIGRVPASEIPLWLRASDVFALTSPSEGFACALLEAMGVGLPSLVSAIPANLQLIDDGIHGLTVPFGNEEATADAFVKLLHDPALRQKMGDEARMRAVGNYSTTKVVERYEALFEKLIAR